MAILPRTRKLLWGGSRCLCAMCRGELVEAKRPPDRESVVGEECHIVSRKESGPRYDPEYPAEEIDEYDNLILLCPVHHKIVDDQALTYTADWLRNKKADHEAWAAGKLREGGSQPKPLRFSRVKENIPKFLARFETAKELLVAAAGCFAANFDYDDLLTDEEVEVVASVAELVVDWSDIITEMEAGERIRATQSLSRAMAELDDAGFWVFGGVEVQRLEGGLASEPSDWPVFIMRIVRKDNKEIGEIGAKE